MTRSIVVVALAVSLPGAAFAQTSSTADARERARARQQAQQERIREQQRQQQAERQRQQQAQRERTLEQRRAAQERAYPARQEERVTRTLKIGGRGELTISNLAGDIVITRRGGNDVQIEAVKIARGRTDDEARAMLPLVNVDFTERGGRAEARVAYPHDGQERTRRHMNVSVNFTVSAPEGTRITVKTLSGHITASDIKGDLSLVSTSGHVTISNAGRISEARSTSGHVEVTATTTETPLELSSVSGNIVVRQVKAPRMELETVSGRVLMEEVDVPRIDAQSIAGPIEFTGRLARNGRYDFNSHAGNVRLVLVGDTGFEFDANSFSGSVQSDFTLKEESGPEDRNRSRRRSLQGVFGDGSALVDVTTFSGSVVLTRK
ncbi:MAG TPA: DUF4097 family beta strand repeat-containing protein [Gemmatimonadaceae bacterium]|nr:DUF4097 family beta strand repeat-containing protein [Gemmatimonadaceae bacterium]